MTPLVLTGVVALALTLASLPGMRALALRLGFVDLPDARKTHGRPIPLLGGVAIFLGAVVAVLLRVGGEIPAKVTGAVLAGALVAAVGLADDRRHLSPWLRLAAQATAGVVLIRFGVQVSLAVPEPVNWGLTVLWLVAVTNAMNLLDNMDGLSSGVAAIAAFWLALLGALNDQPLVATVSAALLGACLGFLRYNFPPASIYMGDSGAYFLGLLVAVLGIQIRFPGRDEAVTWMVPLMVLGVPLLDTTLVVVSRLRRGIHPFTAGRDHLSHRLVRLGLDRRGAVLALYAAGFASGLAGLLVTLLPVPAAAGLGAAWGLAMLGTLAWLERPGLAADP